MMINSLYNLGTYCFKLAINTNVRRASIVIVVIVSVNLIKRELLMECGLIENSKTIGAIGSLRKV